MEASALNLLPSLNNPRHPCSHDWKFKCVAKTAARGVASTSFQETVLAMTSGHPLPHASCCRPLKSPPRKRIRPICPARNMHQIPIIFCGSVQPHRMSASLLLSNAFPPFIELLLFYPAVQPRRIEQLSTPDTLVESCQRPASQRKIVSTLHEAPKPLRPSLRVSPPSMQRGLAYTPHGKTKAQKPILKERGDFSPQ